MNRNIEQADTAGDESEEIKMNDMQMEMWDALCELSGEEVARLFTDYHGTCLLSEGFRTFLGEEGAMPEVEDEIECCGRWFVKTK